MHITRLDLRDFRRFQEASLRPAPGVNLLLGENGAGKTTVLEAMHLMAYGRSFRGRVRDGLIRAGAPALEVFVEWREGGEGLPGAGTAARDSAPPARGRVRRAGLRHTGQAWNGRLDGQDVGQLGDLCAALAVVTFDPGSHVLVSGGGEPRRRYLDWGLFHVEPDFLPVWRRYARALRQRNALLKARAPGAQIDAWDSELATSGEALTRYRQEYLEALQAPFAALLGELAPALGGGELRYEPGWRRGDMSLGDALLLARDRDLAAGYTSAGPHRADWSLGFGALPGRDALSRGQAKLTSLSVLLAQAEHFAARQCDWPVMCFDDLASELDRTHQARVLERLAAWSAQIFITGTEAPSGLGAGLQSTVFHVEHGGIRSA